MIIEHTKLKNIGNTEVLLVVIVTILELGFCPAGNFFKVPKQKQKLNSLETISFTFENL